MAHLMLGGHVFKLQIDFYCAFTTDLGLRVRDFSGQSKFYSFVIFIFYLYFLSLSHFLLDFSKTTVLVFCDCLVVAIFCSNELDYFIYLCMQMYVSLELSEDL